jgi:hypothetical protein
MSPEHQAHYDAFRRGDATVFVIAPNDMLATSLDLRKLTLRKISDEEVAIISFRDRAGADKFLNEFGMGELRQYCRALEIQGEQFRSALKSLGTRRRHYLLELQ